MGLTVGSLFTGIGGFDLGFERAGMDVRWQCEFDPKCRELLDTRWPGVPVYDDVTTMKGADVEPVDVLCGGFPCQDLSVAGDRAGLAGERSGLFHEFMRLAGEIAPRWVVIENVPGLLSSQDGRDMGTVLGVLADLGYGWCYRVLDAQYFGVAQRRRRVFIVGCLGDAASAAAVLLEPESCSGDSPPSREARQEVAGTLGGGSGRRGFCDDLDRSGAFIPVTIGLGSDPIHASDLAQPITGRNGDPGVVAFAWQAGGDRSCSGAFEDDLSPTLPKNQTMAVAYPLAMRGGGKPGQGYPAVRQGMAVRRLTPLECERLQGFPDGWTDGFADSTRYKMLGNPVAVPCAEWIGRQLLDALALRT